jgi:hypothetical protein
VTTTLLFWSTPGATSRTWTDQLAELFGGGGLARGDARRLAVLVISDTEGAVAMARAEPSRQPFDEVAVVLTELAGSSTG